MKAAFDMVMPVDGVFEICRQCILLQMLISLSEMGNKIPAVLYGII